MNAVDEENSIGDDKSPESSKLPKQHETNHNEGRILCHGFVIQLFLSAVEQRQNTLAIIDLPRSFFSNKVQPLTKYTGPDSTGGLLVTSQPAFLPTKYQTRVGN